MNETPSTVRRQKRNRARYIAAINAHPFHDLARLGPCLQSVARAAEAFHSETGERLKPVLFWHNDLKPNASIQARCQEFQVDIVHYPHVSNGKNLNRQLDFACFHEFEFFFRVDADDVVYANRFQLQSAVFSNGSCDVCGGALEYVSELGVKFVTRPPCSPRHRDFVENAFVLHPSLAIRLAALNHHNLRYRMGRMEDKKLYHDMVLAGLRIHNLQDIVGVYMTSNQSRNRAALKFLSFSLNVHFLFATKSAFLMPYAVALFVAHMCIPPQKLRQIRALVQNARGTAQRRTKVRSFKPKLRKLRLF
ncbi:MAG: hypothetical protein AAF754_01430 [Pseudomonadota bacterium]